MLSFMNSKLTKMTDKDKQNHIFQKSKSYEISSTDMYVRETWNLLLLYFPGVSYYTMKSILNVKDNINLIKVISSCNICAGIKSQQEKKTYLSFSIQMFLFFSKFLCSISSSHFLPFSFLCAFN